MKILVAGGAGFIGSHLCDRLLKDGHSVICVDNLITGLKDNIKHHLANPAFTFREADICEGVLKIDGVLDYVVNLASLASPVDYVAYPLETLKVGALGTLNTLELALKKNAKYLFSSTSEVYGDPKVSPQNEEYFGNVNPVGPRSQYDESKRFAEALIVAFRKQHGGDFKIVRIFNTYGPRMRKNDGRVVPNFINQALQGQPLTIYGEGTQTRSFCYVDDMVEGIVKMMNSKELGPLNLGNPYEFTIKELAQEVAKLLGIELKTSHHKLPKDDPKIRRPDISLAESRLSFKPRIDLKKGLALTLKWFRECGEVVH